MKLAAAVLIIALACGGPARAQDSGPTPERGTIPAQPTDPADQPSEPGADAPKPDRNVLIDLLNELTRPPPRQTPPQSAPPVEPQPPVVAAPVAVPPSTTIPPLPGDRPKPAAPAALPVAAPVAPVEPVIAAPQPAQPAPPATPIEQPSAAQAPVAATAQRSTSLLAQSPWLLLALLAAAAMIAGAVAWQRARRIARTRAALSLQPRLDLAEGSCAAAGLAMACPPMSIRTRLEFGGA